MLEEIEIAMSVVYALMMGFVVVFFFNVARVPALIHRETRAEIKRLQNLLDPLLGVKALMDIKGSGTRKTNDQEACLWQISLTCRNQSLVRAVLVNKVQMVVQREQTTHRLLPEKEDPRKRFMVDQTYTFSPKLTRWPIQLQPGTFVSGTVIFADQSEAINTNNTAISIEVHYGDDQIKSVVLGEF